MLLVAMLLFFTLKAPITFTDTAPPVKILSNSNSSPKFKNKLL